MDDQTRFPPIPESASQDIKEWAEKLKRYLDYMDYRTDAAIGLRDDKFKKFKKMLDQHHAEYDKNYMHILDRIKELEEENRRKR